MPDEIVAKIEAGKALNKTEIAALSPMAQAAYQDSLEEQAAHDLEMAELDSWIAECQAMISGCEAMLSGGSPKLPSGL